MSVKNIVNRFASITAGLAVTLCSTAPAAVAQSASQTSIYQAGANAAARLRAGGYTLNHLDNVPSYDAFLRGGQRVSVSVNVPSPGKYVLLVGGDNDTTDLDVYFPQIGASDVTYGRTALISFDVYRTGQFIYDIDMLNCRAPNCGVFAVLLRVGNA